MRAQPLQRGERARGIDDALQRAPGDERGRVAKRQVELGQRLAEQRRRGAARGEARFADREGGRRLVDAVHVASGERERHQQAADAAHGGERRAVGGSVPA